jgi:hypothetical protein
MDIHELEDAILAAINSFDDNRDALLEAAEKQGGDPAVNNLEAQYQDLRSKYTDLLASELAANDPAYANLSDQAGAEAASLQTSITTLNDINETITILSTVISVVASIVALV